MKKYLFYLTISFIFLTSEYVKAQGDFKNQEELKTKTETETKEDIKLFFRFGHINSVKKIDISPDGKTLASLDESHILSIWDIKTRRQIMTISGAQSEIFDICFSADGKYLIGTGNESFHIDEDLYIFYWNFRSGREIKRIKIDKPIKKLMISPNGKYLVCSERGTHITFRDPNTAEELHNIKLKLSSASNFAFSPDGKILAVGTKAMTRKTDGIINSLLKLAETDFSIDDIDDIKKGYIQLINIKSGRIINEIHLGMPMLGIGNLYPRTLNFTPDGNYLIAGGKFFESNLKIIDVSKQEIIKSVNLDKPVDATAVSNDGDYFYTASGNELYLWNGHTFELISRTQNKSTVTDVKFSSDGKYLISGGGNSKAKTNFLDLWDYRSGKKLGTFEAMIPMVTSSAFSPEGNLVIIGTNDGQAQIIDLCSGSLVKTFDVGKGDTKASFSNNGNYIIASTFDWEELQISKGIRQAQITKVWDSKTFHLVQEIPNFAQAMVTPDGNKLISCQNNILHSSLQLTDFASGEIIKQTNISSNIILQDFSPDGKHFAFTKEGLLSGTFQIWDIEKMKETINIKKISRRPMQFISVVRFSPNGKRVICGLANQIKYTGELKEWNVETGKLIRSYSDKVDAAVMTACYSPDGRYVVCGEFSKSRTAKTKIYDVETGKLKDSIDDIGLPFAFTPDGKYMLSYASELMKGVNIVDFETKEILVTFMKIEKKPDCIMYTPNYYYWSTKNGYDAVSFIKGNNVYPFEQFDLLYNRPDLIVKNLPYTDQCLIDMYHRAYKKRLSKMGLTEENLDKNFNVPETKLLNSDEIPISTQNKNITLNINIEDKKYLIDHINVWVNDVPIFGSVGLNVSSLNSMVVNKDISIELSKGSNKIQISALNKKGTESAKVTVNTNYTGIVDKPDLYVIAIGVSKYKTSEFNLDYAAKDATDLINIFETNKTTYKNLYVKTLLDEEATKENIIALKETLNKSKVDDNVVLFVAGHGLLNSELDYYFATYDVDFENPSNRGLAFKDLENLLDGIPARKKLMLVDACHSGEIDKEEVQLTAQIDEQKGKVRFRGFKKVVNRTNSNCHNLKNSFELMKLLFADLRRGSGSMIIASAGGAEFAYESAEWNNGVFTFSVLDGLKSNNADTNKDGIITVSELRDYVADKVQKLTNGNQNPTARRENLEFDFRIW